MQNTRILSEAQREVLLSQLKARFAQNMQRHPGLHWDGVQAAPPRAPRGEEACAMTMPGLSRARSTGRTRAPSTCPQLSVSSC